jgi:phospholipid-binding lipoprotein MlaA
MPNRLARLLVLTMVLGAGPAAAEPEGFNRTNLGFNQWFLSHVLEPTARVHNELIPKWGQRRIVDFMANLEGPRDILNSLAQAKFSRAGIHTGRFVVNTTAGVAGFYDVAGRWLDWTASPETVSETLGVWGVPTGTYLVLPVVGEFCTRSLVGWVGDGFLNPIGYIPSAPPVAPTAGAYVLRNVNLLAQGMPSPRAPDGEWVAYKQSRFAFEPYEVGREHFFQDEAERVAE